MSQTHDPDWRTLYLMAQFEYHELQLKHLALQQEHIELQLRQLALLKEKIKWKESTLAQSQKMELSPSLSDSIKIVPLKRPPADT